MKTMNIREEIERKSNFETEREKKSNFEIERDRYIERVSDR